MYAHDCVSTYHGCKQSIMFFPLSNNLIMLRLMSWLSLILRNKASILRSTNKYTRSSYYIARKYTRPRSIDYTANIDTSIRLHAHCLVFIRADLRSVDIDRSGKAIGHYDTPIINSRLSSTTRTYIPARRCTCAN